jgi:plastocyanin
MNTELLERTTTKPRTSWRTLMRWAALAGITEYVIVMALVEKALIPPIIIVGILLVVGVTRLRGTEPAGVRITTIALGLFLLTNLVFASPSLVVPASFASFAVTWVAVVTGVVGLVAGIATWRNRTSTLAPVRVGLAGTGVAVVAVLIGLVASLGFTDAKPQAGDIVVRAKDSTFVPVALTASHGQVTFFLDNADNALHNFHITGGGTKSMPANHKVRFSATLVPGTYEFLCDLHNDMKGTLTVS